MKKILNICDYSHDYNGFVYVEENCKCDICEKEGKLYLCGDCEKRINLDDNKISRGYNEIPPYRRRTSA